MYIFNMALIDHNKYHVKNIHIYLFYLAMLGLSCGIQDLWLWDLVS